VAPEGGPRLIAPIICQQHSGMLLRLAAHRAGGGSRLRNVIKHLYHSSVTTAPTAIAVRISGSKLRAPMHTLHVATSVLPHPRVPLRYHGCPAPTPVPSLLGHFPPRFALQKNGTSSFRYSDVSPAFTWTGFYSSTTTPAVTLGPFGPCVM